jgi:hypothetical protein
MLRGYSYSGDAVPSIGTYKVHHYQHRLPHLATVVVIRFPTCKHCGDMVRFERIEALTKERFPLLRLDIDFVESCRDIPFREENKKAKGSKCP